MNSSGGDRDRVQVAVQDVDCHRLIRLDLVEQKHVEFVELVVGKGREGVDHQCCPVRGMVWIFPRLPIPRKNQSIRQLVTHCSL